MQFLLTLRLRCLGYTMFEEQFIIINNNFKTQEMIKVVRIMDA